MKKIYEKPEIEAVSYAADTSLCGSCGNMDTGDLQTLGELLTGNPDYFTSKLGWGLFQQGQGCASDIESLISDFDDDVDSWSGFFSEYCKFTAGSPVFVS